MVLVALYTISLLHQQVYTSLTENARSRPLFRPYLRPCCGCHRNGFRPHHLQFLIEQAHNTVLDKQTMMLICYSVRLSFPKRPQLSISLPSTGTVLTRNSNLAPLDQDKAAKSCGHVYFVASSYSVTGRRMLCALGP